MKLKMTMFVLCDPIVPCFSWQYCCYCKKLQWSGLLSASNICRHISEVYLHFPLPAFSIYCSFHYLHSPVTAFSRTGIFHYLHFPVPAFSVTCIFLFPFTCIFLYLLFPLPAFTSWLQPFSITSIFHYLQIQRPRHRSLSARLEWLTDVQYTRTTTLQPEHGCILRQCRTMFFGTWC